MEEPVAGNSSYYDIQRLFLRGITIRDIAEPLASYDSTAPAGEVFASMEAQGIEVAGVRENGLVTGFIERGGLGDGVCGTYQCPFTETMVLPDSAPLTDVVLALCESPRIFVRMLGTVGGLVTSDDLQDPPGRMWLFGMITVIEMGFLQLIEDNLNEQEWRQYLSPARLEKSEALLEERRRRGQNPRLVDCLQFGDKGQIVVRDETLRQKVGFTSRRRGDEAIKNLERLRNNLVHSQDIITTDWEIIVGLVRNIDVVIGLIPQNAGLP
jgi:hypothetical protein